MELVVRDPALEPIVEKVLRGERLSWEDGLVLMRTPDILTLGQLADVVNRRKNGLYVYFIENLHLYHTNICEARCAFCAFRRDPGEEGAFTYTPEELVAYARARITPTTREFHMTGGHNPYVPFSYYVDVIRVLKENFPHVTIKAYTAAEIVFFARISGRTVEEVLSELRDAGLDTLPGGGAEILSERYRRIMSPDKASVDEWLHVHRTAHRMGMKTHATMLYGSIETLEERLEHMRLIRELQDETGGFLAFIPLAVQPYRKDAPLTKRTSAYEDLRMIAVSRLFVDNVPHIKAYWINIGFQLAQLALTFGASDLHGTLVEERISHSAGALTEAGITREELVWLIRGAGRIPVERDTFYNPIVVYEGEESRPRGRR
ncbi:MAG TPA: aminofutalosine synthase MqnE [Bacillaceae bacterium]|nr:aminofutalosine synthase MqnE [Bacillaceae bacterium]